MAFPTANVSVKTGPVGFIAISGHFDAALERSGQWAAYLAAQLHEFAGIRSTDGRDRAGAAQVAGPGSAKQAALLVVTAAVVVTVKVKTFDSSGSSHNGFLKNK